MGARRSIERKEFLSDVAITACYHNQYGFPEIEWASEFDYTKDFTTPFRADITDRYVTNPEDEEYTNVYRVNVDLIAKGINLILKDSDGKISSAETRSAIRVASKENDASDIDVILALAILEVAVFGEVRYS